MSLRTVAEQQRHLAQGEQDVRDWQDLEGDALDELMKREAELKRNPTDATLIKRRDDSGAKLKNIEEARQRRQLAHEAAKRHFGG